jgi:hypothetical protein
LRKSIIENGYIVLQINDLFDQRKEASITLQINDLFDQQKEASMFLKIDLRSRYHQLKIRMKKFTKLLLEVEFGIMNTWWYLLG